MSRRTERLGHLIRRVLADQLQRGLSDPRIPPLTSITQVAVSPDLSTARVHVSVMGTPAQGELCVRGLRHAAGHLQRIVGEEVRMRQTPRLVFQLDSSIKRSFEVVQLIDREMAALAARTPPVEGDAARPPSGDPTPEQECT